MKILYISNSRIPTEKAHGYQICKMCEQFSECGCQVELWLPFRKNFIKENAFGFYNIKNNFKIKKIKCFDWFALQPLIKDWSFKLQSLSFLVSLVFKKPDKESFIYTRNPEIAWLFKLRKYKVVFSAHRWPHHYQTIFKYFLKRVDYIICNSKGTAAGFISNNFSNILIAPNGVDLEKFNITLTKKELRARLNLPKEKKVIMYTGHLYKWKGIETIIATAKKMSNYQDIVFIIVGGTPMDIKKYKNIISNYRISNTFFIGYQPHSLMPYYLKSADILLLPNLANMQESISYTSPLKLFEYMAAGRPIVASDLPSLREILDGGSAVFFQPGSSQDLAEKIKYLLNHEDLGQKISLRAQQQVKQYTWQKRAEKIINFLNKRN